MDYHGRISVEGKCLSLKMIIQSLVVSLIIHLIYIGGLLLAGYIKTRNYIPDLDHKWENVKLLQNDVAFGISVSPLTFLVSFFGVAIIYSLLSSAYKKMIN